MEGPPRFAPSGEPFPEPWDEAAANWLVGKYALVGVVIAGPDGERRDQYHGRIEAADRENGVSIACEGRWRGETLVLPPATGWFGPAQPGEYRLRATGEVVVDPDVLSTWRIEPGERGASNG